MIRTGSSPNVGIRGRVLREQPYNAQTAWRSVAHWAGVPSHRSPSGDIGTATDRVTRIGMVSPVAMKLPTERPFSSSSPTYITMSISVASGESYPGSSLSAYQLVNAAKRKLCGSAFGGRYAHRTYHLSSCNEPRTPQDFDDHEPS